MNVCWSFRSDSNLGWPHHFITELSFSLWGILISIRLFSVLFSACPQLYILLLHMYNNPTISFNHLRYWRVNYTSWLTRFILLPFKCLIIHQLWHKYRNITCETYFRSYKDWLVAWIEFYIIIGDKIVLPFLHTKGSYSSILLYMYVWLCTVNHPYSIKLKPL